jgi:hypothetical protein
MIQNKKKRALLIPIVTRTVPKTPKENLPTKVEICPTTKEKTHQIGGSV